MSGAGPGGAGAPMSLAAAARRIAGIRDSFGGKDLGDKAVRLAYHAALPVAVNAELLNLLRVNFFLDPPDDLPFEAEAALLLSPLFREIGEDLYEIDPALRNVLLSGLHAHPRYGPGRVHRVSALLEQYTESSPAWRGLPELTAAQRLTAVNFLDPPLAEQWLSGTGAVAGAPLDREWYVAMRHRIAEQSVRTSVNAEIMDKLALLDPSPPARDDSAASVADRLAAIHDVAALACLPEADISQVVDGLTYFIEWPSPSLGAPHRVTPDTQAALTLLGRLPHGGFRLTHVQLTGADLAGLDFSRSSFNQVTLSEVDASGINLAGVTWDGGHLLDVRLDGARLDRADLRLQEMRRVSLSGFTGTPLHFSADRLQKVTASRADGSPYQIVVPESARRTPDAPKPLSTRQGVVPSTVSRRFAEDLRQLRQRAGMPSYTTLERLSAHRLRRATMSDVLNNNRVNIPDWPFVSAFVQACHAFVRDIGMDPQGQDPRGLGTVSDWKRHWDLASTGVIAARFPGSPRPTAAEPRPVASQGQPARVPDSQESAADPAPEGDAGVAGDAGLGVPALWGLVPGRVIDFTGREDWLARVREMLVAHGGTSAVAVQGFCGIGKTQLAIEYAHRYKAGYDLVWWVPCDTPGAAREALAELEARLEVPEVPRAPGEGRFAGLFEYLQHGRKYPRWLLVFDNANEPEDVRDLIPQREGHVLITSRNSRWEATAQMLEVDVFSREQSIKFLRSRRPDLGEPDASRLAEATGDLPLLLEHAAESRIPVSRYIARLDTDPLLLLDSRPSHYPVSIASQWDAIIGRLRADNIDALDLLRCLAFFGSGPIQRESLFRGGYLAGVSISPLLRDSIRVSRAILALQRAGLLRVRSAARTLELHRLTRYIIRHMVARDPGDSTRRWEHDVHLLLMATDPGNPDDPESWRDYDELRGHARQSRAEKCGDEQVRGLVVNLVRSQCAAGDPHGALSWAERALNRWSSGDQQGPPEASDAYLAMQEARAEAESLCRTRQEAAGESGNSGDSEA